MGKVRAHILSDAEGLAQWMGRKLNNHDPMSVRDHEAGSKEAKIVAGQRSSRSPVTMRVGIVADDKCEVVYQLRNGKRFVFRVEEIEEDVEVPALVACGG